jgi:hypothetical protein
MAPGLLDTSVVNDWDDPSTTAGLPDESAVCAVTMAEPAAGPHLAEDSIERARRPASRRLSPSVPRSHGLTGEAVRR